MSADIAFGQLYRPDATGGPFGFRNPRRITVKAVIPRNH
jgi:hypothetical protein